MTTPPTQQRSLFTPPATTTVEVGAALTIVGASAAERRVLHQAFDFRYSRKVWERGQLTRESATYPVVWERPEDGAVSLPYGCLSRLYDLLPHAAYTRTTVVHTKAGFPPLIQQREDRDGQAQALASVRDHIRRTRHYGFCIIAPCGAGKSWLGCRLIDEYRQPTLIVVHTKELLKQWQNVIREAFGIEPAIIADGKGAPGPHITIALVQTLARLVAGMAGHFGLIIFDECHHVPAETFAQVAGTLSATVKVGLTATPTRSDGLAPLIEATLGPQVAQITQASMQAEGAVLAPIVTAIRTGWRWWGTDCARNYTRLIGDLVDAQERNRLLAETIAALATGGRRLLVLSSRVNHLFALGKLLEARGVPCQTLHGTLKAAEREAVMGRLRAGYPVTLAIEQLGKEGLDAPILDTLVWATPARDPGLIKQATGRVQRACDGKQPPLVIDFRDDRYTTLGSAQDDADEDSSERLLFWQWVARRRSYKALGADIHEG